MLFLGPYAVCLTLTAGLLTVGSAASAIVVWVFVAGVVLDPIGGLQARKASGAPHTRANPLRLGLRAWIPLHAALVAAGLLVAVREATPGGSFASIWPVSVAVGMAGGIFGVSVAHELMHGRNRLDRALAEVLMTLLSYTHFCIVHVDGHHRDVGTPRDPATARLGESLYAFYPRTIAGGFMSAWGLEARRLLRMRRPVLSAGNRVLRYLAGLVLLYVGIGLAWGWVGVCYFALQGLVALSVLEVINYVGHYGLTRREVAHGQYEPVSPGHAWNSNHRVSNVLLLNLGHHADHHCHASRPYDQLRDIARAPQLPAGYLPMFVLALLPPLWRRVMNPRVHAWRSLQ